MFRLFNSRKDRSSSPRAQGLPGNHANSHNVAPPQWTAAPEPSHKYGKYNEAPENEYEDAESFCHEYPLQKPRLLSSKAVDTINQIGCRAWGIEHPTSPRFLGHVQNLSDSKGDQGVITIQTRSASKDVCLLSNLPIIAGLYDIQGKEGVYYEVLINRMDGIIAIGTACRPYPEWRFPGWNRMSVGLHLDDFRKFYQDADGGRDYPIGINEVRPGDTVGYGYEFQAGVVFFTYNGIRLPTAFSGVYLPRHAQDVFAAIGVEGHCDFQVNFGGAPFRWTEGNEWSWRVEGHVGRFSGASGNPSDELPRYQPGF